MHARRARRAPVRSQREVFGHLPDGRVVERFLLRNRSGLCAGILSYGGILQSLLVPDRHGELADVVLGFDSLPPYLGQHPYFGGLIGRCANRIALAELPLAGRSWPLSRNHGPHHLHGGSHGFDRVLWQPRLLEHEEGVCLWLTYTSPDGDQGYPGNLSVEACFSLNDANELRLDWQASCDATTVINLTQHAWFNLAGQGDVLQHRLQIHGAWYLPVDDGLIPTGEIRLVQNTPMDFRLSRTLADALPLVPGGGFDHNWVLTRGEAETGELQLAAELLEPFSGRCLQLLTTQPGLQFYSGQYLDGSLRGKQGRAYVRHGGLCLEPQHFPDSPHHPHFPSIVLEPGMTWQHSMIYRFPLTGSSHGAGATVSAAGR